MPRLLSGVRPPSIIVVACRRLAWLPAEATGPIKTANCTAQHGCEAVVFITTLHAAGSVSICFDSLNYSMTTSSHGRAPRNLMNRSGTQPFNPAHFTFSAGGVSISLCLCVCVAFAAAHAVPQQSRVRVLYHACRSVYGVIMLELVARSGWLDGSMLSAAVFQVESFITTTGFVSDELRSGRMSLGWPCVCMFFGACSGSDERRRSMRARRDASEDHQERVPPDTASQCRPLKIDGVNKAVEQACQPFHHLPTIESRLLVRHDSDGYRHHHAITFDAEQSGQCRARHSALK